MLNSDQRAEIIREFSSISDLGDNRGRDEFKYFQMLVDSNPKTKAKLVQAAQKNLPSVLRCVAQVASLGLSFNPVLKQVYLVPYWSKDLQSFVCTLMISYKGEIDYLVKQGVILHAHGSSVRSNDEFDHEDTQDGFEYKFKKPRKGPRGPLDGVFAIMTLPDGFKKGIYVPNEQVLQRQKAAKSADFWKMWPDEMYLKTGFRMCRAGLGSSEAVARLEEVDNAHFDFGQFIDEERVQYLRHEFGKLKMAGLNRMYGVLNPSERKHPEILAIFNARKDELKQLSA